MTDPVPKGKPFFQFMAGGTKSPNLLPGTPTRRLLPGGAEWQVQSYEVRSVQPQGDKQFGGFLPQADKLQKSSVGTFQKPPPELYFALFQNAQDGLTFH